MESIVWTTNRIYITVRTVEQRTPTVGCSVDPVYNLLSFQNGLVPVRRCENDDLESSSPCGIRFKRKSRRRTGFIFSLICLIRIYASIILPDTPFVCISSVFLKIDSRKWNECICHTVWPIHSFQWYTNLGTVETNGKYIFITNIVSI